MRGTSEACNKNSRRARPSVRSARIFLEFSQGNNEKSSLFCNLFGINNLEEKMLRMSDSLLRVHDIAEVAKFCFSFFVSFFFFFGRRENNELKFVPHVQHA